MYHKNLSVKFGIRLPKELFDFCVQESNSRGISVSFFIRSLIYSCYSSKFGSREEVLQHEDKQADCLN